MTINFNSPEDEVDGTNITIHAIGDTKSIYENRDTGVEKSVSDLNVKLCGKNTLG